jgi:hypothetical protein
MHAKLVIWKYRGLAVACDSTWRAWEIRLWREGRVGKIGKWAYMHGRENRRTLEAFSMLAGTGGLPSGWMDGWRLLGRG